jgi:histidine ammonia-lyase
MSPAAPHEVPSPQTAPVLLGRPISLSDLEGVARRHRPVALDHEARARVLRAREAIDAIARQGDAARPVYGVNTGFGALAETRIAERDIRALQRNLVRSHACGVGPDLGEAEVRAMMVLRAQVVALGHSGVRATVVDLLIEMPPRGAHPRVPSQGSRTWRSRSSARGRRGSAESCCHRTRRSRAWGSCPSSSRPKRASPSSTARSS